MGYEDHTKRPFSDVFKPIIAAVNGFCIAGGMEFLQGTDIRIAAEGATFGLGEVRWGIIPTGGSHVRLPRQIPWAVAMQMLLTGIPIDARTAADWGLVNEIVPAERLEARTREIAAQIAAASPLVLGIGKEAFYAQIDRDQHAAYDYAKTVMTMNALAADAQEGICAFLEKRQPQWKS